MTRETVYQVDFAPWRVAVAEMLSLAKRLGPSGLDRLRVFHAGERAHLCEQREVVVGGVVTVVVHPSAASRAFLAALRADVQGRAA